MRRPSSTRASAVSSQEVSMPRTRIRDDALVGTDPVRDLTDDPFELIVVVAAPHVVHPHHHRVLTGLLVVVLADAHRPESELAVQPLGTPIRHPTSKETARAPILMASSTSSYRM